MTKKKMLIYPRPASYKNVNTHANVCSFFLSKYLGRFYDLTDSSDLLENPEWVSELKKKEYGTKKRRRAKLAMVMKHLKEQGGELDYCLTTVQRGFAKMAEEKVQQIRNDYPQVKLCSIHDHYGVQKYNEDFLFIAKEIPSQKHLSAIKKGAINKEINPVYMGWCADHKIFNPIPQPERYFNVVLDHAAIQDFRTDATDRYLRALKRIRKENPDRILNLVRLRKGFEFYNFESEEWSHDLSFRWWDSQYDNEDGIANGEGCNIFQIAECLSNSHVFCVTHVESCGLTGIEALMGGCKLYIPRGKDKFVIWGSQGKGHESLGEYKNIAVGRHDGPFIKEDLLRPYMDYSIFNDDAEEMYRMFQKDITTYNNTSDRAKLIDNNSWKKAAQRIHRGLEGV